MIRERGLQISAAEIVASRRVYAVFEGGGAKGIAHVGALAALEHPAIELKGFAGTSAGSIIAALASAGYTASELVDTEARTSVLRHVDRRLTKRTGKGFLPARGPYDLFGPGGWAAILWARQFGADWKALIAAYLLMGSVLSLNVYLLPVAFNIVALILFLIPPVATAIMFPRGLASLDGFVDALEQLLVRKIGSRADSARLTFADLKARDCRPLKIVASNVSERTAKVFSNDTSPAESVAEAVAASICLPVIFKPRQIGPATYYDGGLVSNLPAWTFDEERGLDRDAATVTIEIADAGEATPIGNLKGLNGLIAAVRTALFGSQSLSKRAVANLYSIGLKPEVGVLDFDMTSQIAADEIERAKSDCELRLVYRLVNLHRQMRVICETISEGALGVINAARSAAGLPGLTVAPRVAMALPPVGTMHTLQLAYGWGYEDASDAGLLVPIEGSPFEHCWKTGKSEYRQSGDAEWTAFLARPENHSIRRLLWRDRRWSITIPHEREASDGVALIAALDGAEALGLSAAEIRGLVASLSDGIDTILTKAVPEELFSDGY